MMPLLPNCSAMLIMRCTLRFIFSPRLWLSVFLLLGWWLVAAPGSFGNLQRARLTGRVELLNSKVKARNGRQDASGVVIWLEASGLSARPNRPRQKMNQLGKRFLPHVMVVEKGTEVDFPNSDLFFHNVFSLFNGKRFDLGLYASGESRPVLFNRVGISYIFCNIHPLMSGIVVAVDTPYYAISEASGQLTINDVPEGRYQLKVWHERTTPQELTNQTRNLQISTAGTFDLGVIRINEAGYIPQPHPNKHGQPYDNERNKPAYKR
jgi:plastocyanin